jgi:type IV pilus assembly protein PilM
MAFSRPRKNASTPANAGTKPAPDQKGRRSLGDLAKMDMGELMSTVRLPRLPSRGARPARSDGRLLVGLDIEPGYVTAAQVSVNGKIAVERAAGTELSPEIVRDGEVVDVPALSEALKTLFAEHKLDNRVRLGIANQRIVVRTLELPPIADQAELEAAVRFQAQSELPMALDSAVIDFHSLGVVDTDAGPRQRVVLVAARREMIERLLLAAREAGLRPEGIDLSAFALIRSLHTPGAPSDERAVYLSLGGLGNLAVAEGTMCQFTRVLSIGFESIAAEVAERLGVSVLDARGLLLRVGLRQPARDDVPSYGQFSAPASHHDLFGAERQLTGGEHDLPASERELSGTARELSGTERELLGHDAPTLDGGLDEPADEDRGSAEVDGVVSDLVGDAVRRVSVEIRNSLHYHAIHGGDHAVSRVYVSGSMTQIPGLVAALAEELELDLELRAIAEARAGALGSVPAERVAIAAGLAVGEAPA